jgi:hypothetical protein
VLDEWVVMPNHVHALVRPLEGNELPMILHSWKSFSAHAANQELKRTGPFWQKESYDHIVRSAEELNRIREYIRRNPVKAGIQVAHAGSRRDACGTTAAETAAIQEPVPQASRLHREAAEPAAAQETVSPREPSWARQRGLTRERDSQWQASRLLSENETSAFAAFMHWSDWLYAQTGTTGNLHTIRLAKLLLQFLTEVKTLDERTVAEALFNDHQRSNRPDVPGFLKKFAFAPAPPQQSTPSSLPRQSRHQGNA